MNTSIFKVDKYIRYSVEQKEVEQYTIMMYSKDAIMCTREELTELKEIIDFALNDQKEVDNGKTE